MEIGDNYTVFFKVFPKGTLVMTDANILFFVFLLRCTYVSKESLKLTPTFSDV